VSRLESEQWRAETAGGKSERVGLMLMALATGGVVPLKSNAPGACVWTGFHIGFGCALSGGDISFHLSR